MRKPYWPTCAPHWDKKSSNLLDRGFNHAAMTALLMGLIMYKVDAR